MEGNLLSILQVKCWDFFFQKNEGAQYYKVLLCVAVAASQVSHQLCLDPDFQFHCTDTTDLKKRISYISWQEQ